MIKRALSAVFSVPRNSLSNWNAFWFESDPFAQLRIFRVALGLTLLGYYFLRTFDLDLLYTNGGILPLETFNAVVEQKFAYSIFQWFPGRAAVWGAHLLIMISCVFLIAGRYSRLAALLVYLLHVSFDNRNPLIVYGFNKIVTFFLFNLIFAAYLPTQAPEGSVRRALASVALRLTQIQLCIIYLFAGTEKLKGPLWWRGEAIWGVLANSQTTTFDFSFMAQMPILITIATYATLVWEIYFPVLVWSGRVRYTWLLGGVLLHASIGIMMNLPFFALLMVGAYSVFLRKHHALELENAVLTELKKVLRFSRRSDQREVTTPSLVPESGT